MTRKTGLIAFLGIQAVAVVIWLMALLPLMREGSAPFISTVQETFTGRIFSSLSFNFRSGETSVTRPISIPWARCFWRRC